MRNLSFDTTNITVRLDRAQVVNLDTLATEIRGRHGAAVSRSGILRALISGLFDAPLNLSACSSEDELFQAIRSLVHTKEESELRRAAGAKKNKAAPQSPEDSLEEPKLRRPIVNDATFEVLR